MTGAIKMVVIPLDSGHLSRHGGDEMSRSQYVVIPLDSGHLSRVDHVGIRSCNESRNPSRFRASVPPRLRSFPPARIRRNPSRFRASVPRENQAKRAKHVCRNPSRFRASVPHESKQGNGSDHDVVIPLDSGHLSRGYSCADFQYWFQVVIPLDSGHLSRGMLAAAEICKHGRNPSRFRASVPLRRLKNSFLSLGCYGCYGKIWLSARLAAQH